MKHIVRLLLLMLTLAPITFSQSTFGTIRGTISDDKGAAIANTTIRIINQDENAAREVVTDAQGNYEAPNLKAGRYQVRVKKDGFKEYLQSDLWLDARQVLRVDVSLQIGRIDETVTITGGAGVISTETQTVSSNLKSQQVLSLPANVRGNRSTSPYALVSVLPGVQSDNSFNFSIHGALPHQTEVTVDGVSTVDVRRNGPQRENFPSAESIAEMKVQAVGSNAEYGQVGDITTTSKGGTNQFHGSAFNYHQNAALDATPFGSTTKPAKVANTFGGSFGGPIFKERTFFFGAYEGMRFRSASTIQNLVPTQALRNGDFSGLSVALRNPFNNNQPFANNRIPDNLINPVAKKILELYPLPNTTGAAVNFVENRPSPIDSDQYDIRGDHNLTSKQSLFGRWTWKDIDQQEPTRLELPGVQRFVNSRNLVISHNYTITPAVLNEFRFGWSYRKLGLDFPFDTVAFARSLCLQGLGNLRPNILPTLSFNGVITDLSQNRQLEESKNYQFNNNVTWNWGRHTFKFGVDYRRLGTTDITTFTSGDDYGVYNFRGAFTGNNFADFLLGLPDAVTIAVTNVDVDGFANHYHFFAQDNFKISPKLTLEYGLRYELHAPFKDRNFNIGNFDRDTARTGRVIVPSDPRQKELAPVPNAVLNAINACGAPNPPAPVPGVGCTPVLSAKSVPAAWLARRASSTVPASRPSDASARPA
jgi:Carboxypeptidase regulatory-like domain